VDAACEAGAEARLVGIVRDELPELDRAVRGAVADCDIVLLSGGTSKGAGDVSYRVLEGLGPPGIIPHGVALKPGKPLRLAAVTPAGTGRRAAGLSDLGDLHLPRVRRPRDPAPRRPPRRHAARPRSPLADARELRARPDRVPPRVPRTRCGRRRILGRLSH